MSEPNPLAEFIDHARSKGLDHPTIRTMLLAVGWKDKQINEALVAGQLDMPVPLPAEYGGARLAFMYLLTFAMLHAAAVALIILYFTYIDRLLPDPAWDTSLYREEWQFTAIRMSLSSALVTFPLFYFLSFVLVRDIRRNPDHARSPIRRWLTYLTLFIAAATVACDAVTLVFYLLEGQLSARVLLKGLVLMAIGAFVLIYYALGLRDAREVKP